MKETPPPHPFSETERESETILSPSPHREMVGEGLASPTPLPAEVASPSRKWIEFLFRALFVLNAGLVLTSFVLLGRLLAQGEFSGSDFTLFHAAWSMIHAGEGSRVYDLDRHTVYYRQAYPDPALCQAVAPFLHPPHSTLLLGLLGLLPCSVAFYVWSGVQVCLCLLAAWLLAGLTADWDESSRLGLAVGTLGFPALFVSFQLGQMAVLGVVCLLGFVWGVKKDRPWTVALSLAVASAVKPQLVVVPLVFLLARGKWRPLLLLGLLLLPWLALTGVVLGWGIWPDYLRQVQFATNQFGTFGFNVTAMYNLKSLLTALLGAEHASLINLLTSVCLVLSVGLVFWLWWGRQGEGNFDLRMGLSLLLGQVSNPHCMPADALLLVVPAFLFFAHLLRHRLATTLPGATLLLCPLLFLLDVARIQGKPWTFRYFVLLELAFAVWMAWLIFRTSRSAPSPGS